jgi:hypothetical protein
MTIRGGLASAMALGGAVLACGESSGSTCACSDPSVVVVVPPDLATAVSAVQLQGTACSSSRAVCLQPAGSGCSELSFEATAPGMCTIDVLFSSGPSFQAVRRFVTLQCCKGFYADPLDGATITVPSGADDAGAAG